MPAASGTRPCFSRLSGYAGARDPGKTRDLRKYLRSSHADQPRVPASIAFTAPLPKPANQGAGKTGGAFRQAGRMPGDPVMLPAHEIPPDCTSCTWVACASGKMKLKFINGHCPHAAESIPWDYAAWYAPPSDEIPRQDARD
jgi:hypothetical protein